MLTKLSQWVPIWYCSLLHRFLSKSHNLNCSTKPIRCSLLYISFRTMDCVIIPHQVLLSKTAKHWDGFVSHSQPSHHINDDDDVIKPQHCAKPPCNDDNNDFQPRPSCHVIWACGFFIFIYIYTNWLFVLYLGLLYVLKAQGEFWWAAVTKMGPNDTSKVVWAISEFLNILLYTKYY